MSRPFEWLQSTVSHFGTSLVSQLLALVSQLLALVSQLLALVSQRLALVSQRLVPRESSYQGSELREQRSLRQRGFHLALHSHSVHICVCIPE